MHSSRGLSDAELQTSWVAADVLLDLGAGFEEADRRFTVNLLVHTFRKLAVQRSVPG